MSNIIALNVPPRRQRLSDRVGALIDVFATQRRIQDDVFWLKENAELLSILECTGTAVDVDHLAPHRDFYDGLRDRLQFFPQYYRFLLSIGLDLEDLGLPGDQMTDLCHWVAQRGLPDAELSDLQRAEAQRLLARRGVVCAAADPGLNGRLRRFIDRSDTFALPNKKAAYELTHIVFYLSEYGRRDPRLGPDALRSLRFAGILAHMDQNMDLLAEICVALCYAGVQPDPIWVDAVRSDLSRFAVSSDGEAIAMDGYHDYLVSNWAMRVLGFDDTGAALPVGRVAFHRPERPPSALRGVSSALFAATGTRHARWDMMCDYVFSVLDDDTAAVLEATLASTTEFDAFFEIFARA